MNQYNYVVLLPEFYLLLGFIVFLALRNMLPVLQQKLLIGLVLLGTWVSLFVQKPYGAIILFCQSLILGNAFFVLWINRAVEIVFLPVVLGGFVMVSASNPVTLFIGLEIVHISMYQLLSIRRKDIILGISSFLCIALGFSSLYFEMVHPMIKPIGLSCLLLGFGLRMTEGKPDKESLSQTRFDLNLSKVIQVLCLISLLFRVYEPSILLQKIILIYGITIVMISNLLLIRQNKFYRFLFCAGAGQFGTCLIPIGIMMDGNHPESIFECVYILLTSLFSLLGVQVCFTLVTDKGTKADLSGMYYRSPYLCIILSFFIFTLTGLPITSGFFSKGFVLLGLARVHMYEAALLYMGSQLLAISGYFSLIRHMYLRVALKENPIHINFFHHGFLWICITVLFILGIAPQWLMHVLKFF